jgi:predicted SprT family Zn-dependent metalloprotease
MIEKLIAIQREANQYLHEYDLYDKGWRFEFSSTQRRIGDCDSKSKVIRFSKHYIASSPEQITDTLLHEIAHALDERTFRRNDPSANPHDYIWQDIARIVGCRPEACSNESTNTAKPNYRIKCPKCGWKVDRFRLKRKIMTEAYGAYCPECGHHPLDFFKLSYRNTQ